MSEMTMAILIFKLVFACNRCIVGMLQKKSCKCNNIPIHEFRRNSSRAFKRYNCVFVEKIFPVENSLSSLCIDRFHSF